MSQPSENLFSHLRRVPLVPLVQAAQPEVAVRIAEALCSGGLAVIEVVLRTPAALQCLQAIRTALPDAIVGAGTVLNAQQARDALDAGATFIVSPGLDEGVVGFARAHGLPVLPGVATATEAQHAWNLGLDTVKFFPAAQAGGPAMLRALAAVFPGLAFMPTGGVTEANLAEYLAIPSVLACGGSWLTPADAVAAGDYAHIAALAEEAVDLASIARRG